MKLITWNKEKNDWLKDARNISFEQVVEKIKLKQFLEETENPNQKKYPGQHVFIIDIHKYIYVVPYVEDEEKIFLKTVYPSRKHKKQYAKGEKNETKKI